MDKIKIKELQVETVIGIFDCEREVKQLLSIDIELEVNSKKAGKTDNIKDAVDYKSITKRVISLTRKSKSKLIENLAEKIAKTLLTEFKVERINISLNKPGALRGSKSVGITISRP